MTKTKAISLATLCLPLLGLESRWKANPRSRIIYFQLQKLVLTPMCAYSPLPPLLAVDLYPSSLAVSHPPPLLLAAIHTPPACGVIHPFLPSGHPPSLLAVKFTPHRRAVIFYPSCWRCCSPLPAQRSYSTPCWRSNSPFSASGHPPSLLAVKFTPPHPPVIFHPSCW